MVDAAIVEGLRVDGRYVLERPLGEGTFGSVWRARDERLAGRVVGIKFLKPEFLDHAEAVARFENEANALARVQHANVVAVIDRGDWNRHRYFVLEYVEGCDLDAWLRPYRDRGEAPPLDLVARIMDQVCAGLAAAHAVRVPGPIVHRDLKPANVMLRSVEGDAPEAKVLDFGIAQLGSRLRTRTGGLMGTPLYMAPEQGLGRASQVGPATDVFALGVILVELLTLRAQLSDEELWWAVSMQRSAELRTILGGLRSEVAGAVWDVAARAMQSAPADRFPDAARMREALREAWKQQAQPVAATIAMPAISLPPMSLPVASTPRTPTTPLDAAGSSGPPSVGATVLGGPAVANPPVTRTVLSGTVLGAPPAEVTGQGGVASAPSPRSAERWVVGALGLLTVAASGVWAAKRFAGATVAVAAPRSLAPMTGALVIDPRPEFRWLPAAGATRAQVELCRDRGCTTVAQRLESEGAAVRPEAPLARGAWFWRLRGGTARGFGAPGPTRSFVARGIAPGAGNEGVSARLAGDVNGDGRDDFAVCNSAGQPVVVPGSADGLDFARAVPLRGAGESCTPGAAVALTELGDVNGDGFPDFGLVSAVSSVILVWNGTPGGLSSAPSQRVPFPRAMDRAASIKGVGDVTGDGFSDAIWVTRSDDVWFFRGGEAGLAQTADHVMLPRGGTAGSLTVPAFVQCVRDVNGDGRGDVAVTRSDGAVDVYAGTGDASGFPAEPTWRLPLGPSGATGRGFAILGGDLDGNGVEDLVTVLSDPAAGSARVTVHRGGPAGPRADEAWTVTLPTSRISMLPLMDTDGDGYEDLLVATDAGRVRYRGGANGLVHSGPYAEVDDPSLRSGTSLSYFMDLDGDGLGDLLTAHANRPGSPVLVLYRAASPTGRVLSIP